MADLLFEQACAAPDARPSVDRKGLAEIDP